MLPKHLPTLDSRITGQPDTNLIVTKKNPVERRLFEIIEPVCLSAGCELVDVKYTLEQGGWVMRVFIDRLAAAEASDGGGAADATEGTAAGTAADNGVSLSDCERMSRELSSVLDVEDPVPQAYRLEVSSPGLDRPLRTAAHFQRFVGETVKVVLGEGLEGRRNFKGEIAAVTENDAGATVAVLVDGMQFELPIDDIESARVVPNWDRLLKGGSPGNASR